MASACTAVVNGVALALVCSMVPAEILNILYSI